ncbi:MAG: hypothetical protein IPH57_18980 [Saprospiraceae bacterium]|nr:hypothetical protein [Saprospiraceae bacterium]
MRDGCAWVCQHSRLFPVSLQHTQKTGSPSIFDKYRIVCRRRTPKWKMINGMEQRSYRSDGLKSEKISICILNTFRYIAMPVILLVVQ